MPCPDPRFPALTERHLSERDGRLWLWDGDGDFDVSDSELEPWQLRHGIGREHFHAPIEPAFDPVEVADALWGANAELPE